MVNKIGIKIHKIVDANNWEHCLGVDKPFIKNHFLGICRQVIWQNSKQDCVWYAEDLNAASQQITASLNSSKEIWF